MKIKKAADIGENLKILIVDIIASFLLSSAFAVIFNGKSLTDIGYADEVNISFLIFVFFAVLCFLLIIKALFSLKGIPSLICVFSSAFMFNAFVGDNFYFTVTVCMLLTFLIMFIQKEEMASFQVKLSCHEVTAMVCVCFFSVAFITAYACVMRYLSYRSSNFDLGIFARMFESMATTFRAETTNERNILMSHFGVHFSPVLYLLLPFYMIFRTPAFLVAVQPFIVLSGVFPFMLLMRKREKNEFTVFLYCAVFILFPAFVSPCYYDFHENIFFTPFILWLLFFIERSDKLGTVLFALLVFSVKEEAGLYTASIGLYMIFGMRKEKTGVILIIASLVHFFSTTWLVTLIGGQTLSGMHYSNMISGDSGMLSILKTVILSPAYTVSQLFNGEKLIYILYMFLPTLFLTFRTKKFSLFFLLIPLVMMNLITDYCYQFDIHYQYGFATGALIMYTCTLNCDRVEKPENKAVICLAMCILLCSGITLPKIITNVTSYQTNTESIKRSDDIIKSIPENASVAASTFLIPKLYKVKELYMLEKDAKADTDYVIIDKRYEDEYRTAEINCIIGKYKLISENGYVRVYHKQS